ncbi:glycosyltransferase family 4 protein [Candidatus Bathyarchaeota archaeon]|nr:glycosyltransferase family 4 protein [Candidatus Bathyarchaeota archaeon]
MFIYANVICIHVRVCFTEDRFLNKATTGPARHIRQLTRGLASRGHSVIVFCEENAHSNGLHNDLDSDSTQNLRIVQLKAKGRGPLRRLEGLLSGIRDENPDLVHSQGYRNATTDMAAMACVMNRIPFVLSPRGSLFGHRVGTMNTMTPIAARAYDFATAKATLKVAEAVVVTCESERREAISIGLDPSRVRLIPHGMEFPVVLSDIGFLRGSPKLLTVSRLTPLRNILDIIRSVEAISREFPEVVLYIAGDAIPSSHNSAERDYPNKVRALADDPALSSHVVLLGGVYGQKLWDLYSSCDLFIHASDYENFGFGLLEAAFFGLPLVSTDVGVASNLIQNGRGGILIPNHEPEAIAKAACDILRDPSAIQVMREYLKSLSKEYSVSKDLDEHLRLYQEVIESMHR